MNWAIITAVIVLAALLAVFLSYEKQTVNTKEISLIATMATLAAVLRVPFSAIISVQPTTFIVMLTGYVFGARAGFMVGAIGALVSNIFLGHGPWTPWQMLAWGLAGWTMGLLGQRQKGFNFSLFVFLGFLWGYLFGWIMNLWHWLGFVYPLTFKTFMATYLISIPADTLHSAGNVVFTLIFGKTLYTILTRYKAKISYVKLDKF
ncbi:MAG: ECF transporter S component [Clostridia bacterium]|nr:ECF transporter S component [Clostridia bacterium]